jgi:hypothetical protein
MPPPTASSAATFAFEGTVVACETRFDTHATTAFAVDEIDANWVLTIKVDRADPLAPAAAGATASFLIHSPSRTLFASAADAIGHRFAFTIHRRDTPTGTRWSDLAVK